MEITEKLDKIIKIFTNIRQILDKRYEQNALPAIRSSKLWIWRKQNRYELMLNDGDWIRTQWPQDADVETIKKILLDSYNDYQISQIYHHMTNGQHPGEVMRMIREGWAND